MFKTDLQLQEGHGLGKLQRPHCSPSVGIMAFPGKSSPFMAQQFRLVNCYNLPRSISSWETPKTSS